MSTTHYLTPLLEPRALAVIGASEKAGSIGEVILRNVLTHGYRGRVWAVNPRYQTVLGQPCVASVEEIGQPVDLALITTAPRAIPQIIEQCGRAGVRHVIIVTHPASVASNSATVERRIRDAARNAGVRILGPKSLGVVRPSLSLNATFTEIAAEPGDLALVAQSGAMCSAVLDWATMNRIGVSTVVSLGAAMDVDFGDLLDYLANDERTRYILLHVEKIRHARSFMSALRSAARVKPVILLKSGHHAGDEMTGDGEEALAMSDQVFEAAVRRAGVVRVRDLGQLFHAARALAAGFHPRGSRLAIVSNGTGPATMAADSARRLGIPLAVPTPETVTALRQVLPRDWRGRNPIDLGGDATTARYLDAIRLLAADPGVDAVLVVLSPLAMVQPRAVAEGIVELTRNQRVTLCCCFMGGAQIGEARALLEAAGIPVFRTPDTVIELFHNISTYYENQKLLLQVPSPGQQVERAGTHNARALMEALIAERRKVLSTMETSALLRTFGIPVRPAMVAHTATEAMFIAEQVGLPVDVSIESPDLPAEAEEGAVRRNLGGIDSVRMAFHDLVEARRRTHPEGRWTGVAIAPHSLRPNARVLMLKVFRDPVFGPVIALGRGGSPGEVLRDQAVALPPLNGFLARALIDASRVGSTLGSIGHLPAVDLAALEETLLGISNLVCELPWIESIELNPLLVDEHGCLAVDARMVIDSGRSVNLGRYAHMAIHPYPADLCQEWPMRDGTVIRVRPVRPEDAALEQAFVNRMSDESRYYRFMDATRELPPSQIIRFTQVDYDREMALIAVVDTPEGERQIGSARYGQTPDGESVEFALAVDDQWQKCGLGRRLMEALIDCARDKFYRTMVGDVLADNQKMLRLMERLGFAILPHPEGSSQKRVVKPLRE